MNEASMWFSHDDDYRTAVSWWIRLKEYGSDPSTLREFTSWLAENAGNRRTYAHVETLSLRVDLAISKYLSTGQTSESDVRPPSGKKAG